MKTRILDMPHVWKTRENRRNYLYVLISRRLQTEVEQYINGKIAETLVNLYRTQINHILICF